jgi:hypothetical protein
MTLLKDLYVINQKSIETFPIVKSKATQYRRSIEITLANRARIY